ncbi:MAG: EpsG family protein [Clostridia bacterium]|nr:EpsG family protein [Clostridia bacterium]
MTIFWALLSFTGLLYPVMKFVLNKQKGVPEFKKLKNNEIKLYFILVSIAMILVIGLRGVLVGRDTLHYYYSYASLQRIGILQVLRAQDVTEKGYMLFEVLSHRLHLGFAGYNLLYASFNISIISYIIYKKSRMPWLSYFIYICFEFFILDLTMMRQTLAISIVALAITLDKNETFLDFLKFALCVFIAQTFHQSAIIALPLWFLKKLPLNNIGVVATLFVILLGYLMRTQIAGLIGELAGDVSEKYTKYGELEEGTAGMRLYLMVAVTIALGMILGRYKNIKGNGLPFYSLCMMLFLFPAVQAGGVFMRIYYYYYIFIILYVPNLVAALDPKKDTHIKILIVLLYLAVGIYFFHLSLGPGSLVGEEYKFFWQPIYD